MSLDIILACSIITLALFNGLDASTHKWSYLIIHSILRLEEMASVVCVNMFVMKKKPKGVEGTVLSQTQSASIEFQPADSSVMRTAPTTVYKSATDPH